MAIAFSPCINCGVVSFLSRIGVRDGDKMIIGRHIRERTERPEYYGACENGNGHVAEPRDDR